MPAAAAVTGNGSTNGEAAANGSAHHGATNGQDVDATDTRGPNGFATLLRRALPTRPPEAASTDEDDAFFDFLRGALEDHEPLGPARRRGRAGELMTSPILQPSRVDLVPAEAVESIMADTQRELGGLDSERANAEAAADEAERQATSGAGDPAFHAWVAGHADRFVQSLRDRARERDALAARTAGTPGPPCVEPRTWTPTC